MALAAMGANSRPPDIGAGSRPPDQGGHLTSTAPTGKSSTTPRSSGTPAWAGARPASGESDMKRPYKQIIKEANSPKANVLLQITMNKIFDRNFPESKPLNLTDLQMSELISDVFKIPLTDCCELDSQTGRYEKRELLVSPNADLTNAVITDPIIFRKHEIKVTIISNGSTKVTFKGVPITVPNEELIHLCSHYGKTDGIVTRQYIRLGNEVKHEIMNSTRTVQVQLFPWKYMKNFYWLSGPSQGERGRRVTVLHANQPPQCSHCFKYSPPSLSTPMTDQHCKGGANGKICKTLNTERTSMNSYIKSLREEGYISLRDKYYDSLNAFPALGEKATDTSQDPNIVNTEDQTGNNDDDELNKEETTVESTLKEAEKEEKVSDDPSTGSLEDDPTTGEPHTEKPQTPTGDQAPTHPPKQSTTKDHVTNAGEGLEKGPLLEKEDKPEEPTKGTREKVPTLQVKHTEEPLNLEKRDTNKDSAKDIQGRLRSCSVSLLRPLSKLSITLSSPNHTPVSPNGNQAGVSPTTNQGLRLLEHPLIKYLTEAIPYSEEQLKSYVIQAVVQGEITYKAINDKIEETPELGKMILKGCKENSPPSNKKKSILKKLEVKIKEVSKLTEVKEAVREREEGKKKGRLASPTKMSGEESLSKTVRVISPKIK